MTRIVMWSGPRNLSTAMMRSFGARADTLVVDEPFYAPYLATTGIDHPMRAEVMASRTTDWSETAKACAAPQTEPPIRYEKHITTHCIDGAPRAWMAGARIAFLIRDPAWVAASFKAKWSDMTLDDIGISRQAELYDYCSKTFGPPPVIDADDVRRDPERTLRALCAALDIPFDPAMLHWPAGPRDTDGVWAKHWYGAVERSTGFAPPPEGAPEIAPALEALVEKVRPTYKRLKAHAL